MEDLLRYNGADVGGFVLTFISLQLLGSHRRSGFIVGIVASVVWGWFSIQVDSKPTLLANFVFAGMNLRGYLRWSALKTGGDDSPAPEGAAG